VWQEKVKVVVMLTNVVEGGQRKCEQYWPDQKPQEYGPFEGYTRAAEKPNSHTN